MKIIDNIDQKLWKSIQDKFSQIVGQPVITLDMDGKTISKSGEYPFFCQLMQNNADGRNRCDSCQRSNFSKLINSDKKIMFFTCHADLTYVMVPIIVKDKKIGAVMVPS